jgi:translation initiation factor 1
MPSDSELVWSSDGGDFRPAQKQGARKGKRRPQGPGAPGPAPAGSTIKVKRETSGRKGKTATTISEIPLGEDETRALAKRLKQHCGVGGTARGSSIELQGDHRDKVITFLEKEGHRAVRAGG